MESFQSSVHTVTVAQAFQQLTPLPGEFDVAKNTPTVVVNAAELVHTVQLLWAAVKDQRGFLDVVERDMARRRTEMEVRFQKMQNDVDSVVKEESRRRHADQDKLRAEIASVKTDVQSLGESLRKEAKDAQNATQRLVELSLSTMKHSISETQQRIGDVVAEVSHLKDALSQLKADKEAAQHAVDKIRSEVQSNFSTLCTFLGANTAIVQQAVSNGTEKEAMLKTIALQTLSQRIKIADEKGDAAKADAAKAATECGQLSATVTRMGGDLVKVEGNVTLMDQQLRGAIAAGDDKLSVRLDNLEKSLSAQLAHLAKGLSSSGGANAAPKVEQAAVPPDAAKKADLDAIRAAMEQLKHDVGVRIAQKADQFHVNASIAGLQETLSRLQSDLAAMDRSGSGPLVSATSGAMRAADVERLSAAIADVTSRIEALERATEDLSKNKVDRTELRVALADLAKKLEVGLTELYQQIQTLKSAPTPAPPSQQDSTAGRFRCISCNRDAGPLQEQIQERLSKAQFPPSPMIVSQASAAAQHQPRSIVQSRQAVPGLKEYGGAMTSSRKKLMNYYVWLQDKNEHPQPQTAGGSAPSSRSRPTSAGKVREGGAVSPRSTSPGGTVVHPPSHPWSGAQSGNGQYGERQCGDHGSPEPQAVGVDGKYYVGVISTDTGGDKVATLPTGGGSRPRSAPLHGRGQNAEGPPPTAVVEKKL